MEMLNIKDDLYQHLNTKVCISGNVKAVRNHGHKQFIDIIFANEEIQIVSTYQDISLKKGNVIEIVGKLVYRDENNRNMHKKHGVYEIVAESIKILNKNIKDLPFDCYNKEVILTLSEDIKQQYRSLFLRSDFMQKNLRMRSKIVHYIREYMHNHEFTEVFTPILTSTTPEGARDYVVPSRLHAGKFYGLPQSPQQFKQTLMVSGIDKYFSIAPCFRDEKATKNRLANEFYQLDVEVSFGNAKIIIEFMCNLVINILNKFCPNKKINITVMSYDEAVNNYGNDKPDLRITNKLINAPEYICNLNIMKNFKQNQIKALRLQLPIEAVISIYNQREANDVQFEYLYNENNILKGKLSKFITNHDIQNGEVLFFAGGDNACKSLAFVRNCLIKILPNIVDFAMVVVNNFPMFEKDDNGNPTFCHNPFSRTVGRNNITFTPCKFIKHEDYAYNATNYGLNSDKQTCADNDCIFNTRGKCSISASNTNCEVKSNKCEDNECIFSARGKCCNINNTCYKGVEISRDSEAQIANDPDFIYKIRAEQYDKMMPPICGDKNADCEQTNDVYSIRAEQYDKMMPPLCGDKNADCEQTNDVYSIRAEQYDKNAVFESENIYDIRAEQYDIVLNGYELASGSERNTDLEQLMKDFEMCGYQREKVLEEFNLIFESFSYGIVPHAGFAIGIERLIMIILNIDNIRDIVAFPLPTSGYDPLTNTPKLLSENILKELHLQIIK